jgi:hypothetical protein
MADEVKLEKAQWIDPAREALENQEDLDDLDQRIKEAEAKEAAKKRG